MDCSNPTPFAVEIEFPEATKEQRSIGLSEHGTLTVKIYAPRRIDPQKPHTRDEIYVVPAAAYSS
jgi:hypothetical protein